MNESRKAVVTVLGMDRKGIIARVTTLLYENDINILDITQSIVSGMFTMVLIADVSSPACDFDATNRALNELGRELGVEVQMRRSEIFEAMHEV